MLAITTCVTAYLTDYQVSLDTGHFGAGGRTGRLRELAFEYAFLYSTANVAAAPLASRDEQ